jgi:hypothetical protein
MRRMTHGWKEGAKKNFLEEIVATTFGDRIYRLRNRSGKGYLETLRDVGFPVGSGEKKKSQCARFYR